MKKKYKLSEEKCQCSLLDFYRNVAEISGVKITQKIQYDCKKIYVTKPVQDCIWEYYHEIGYTDNEIMIIFLHYGPKASLPGSEYEIQIEKGFVIC